MQAKAEPKKGRQEMKLKFIMGSSYDAEYLLIDWGRPWNGQRVRVYRGVDPICVEDYKARVAEYIGYMTGYPKPPLEAVTEYNAMMQADYDQALAKYGAEFAGEPPTPLRGVAWYEDGELHKEGL